MSPASLFTDFQESILLVAGDSLMWALAFFVVAGLVLALHLPVLAVARRLLNQSR